MADPESIESVTLTLSGEDLKIVRGALYREYRNNVKRISDLIHQEKWDEAKSKFALVETQQRILEQLKTSD